MFKKITSSLQKISSFYFKTALCLGALFVISESVIKESFAQNPDLNESIVKEIEDTLLFNQNSKKEVGFAAVKKVKKKKKSDIVIQRGVKEVEAETSSLLKVEIVKSKKIDFVTREKEKLAYNASLVEQYEASIHLYKEVLEAEPDNEYAKFSLAVLYHKIGQLPQAKVLYYEVLKTNPDNKEEIIGNLLSILIEESPKEATYLLSRLVVQNPESSYIVAQAALAYYKIKDYDNAILMFKKAVALEPKRVDYKYNLAVIYDKNGDYHEALKTYSDVIKAYNSSENQLTSVSDIEKRIQSIKLIL